MDTLAKCVPKPKILPQRAKAMTCIVGLQCQGGVVLGADMEINDPYTTVPESKIRKRTEGVKSPYFLAYSSNDVDAAKESINHIKRAIASADWNNKSITKATREKYKEEYEHNKENGFALIWAFKHGPKYRLRHLCNGSDVADPQNAINGVGYIHAIGFMQELHSPNMSLREGVALAVFLVTIVKIRAPGVGKQTQVLTLKDSGEYSMLSYSYVQNLETAYERIYRGINPLILGYTDWENRETFPKKLAQFKNAADNSRSAMQTIYTLDPESEIEKNETIQELMG